MYEIPANTNFRN